MQQVILKMRPFLKWICQKGALGAQQGRLFMALVDRRHLIFVQDLFLAALCAPLALWIRTGSWDALFQVGLLKHALVYTLVCAAVYLWLQLYRSTWQYLSWQEGATFALASAYGCALYFPLMVLMGDKDAWPRSVILVLWAVTTSLLCLSRLAHKVLRARLAQGTDHLYTSTPETRLLFLGSAPSIQKARALLNALEACPYEVLGALETKAHPLETGAGIKVLGATTDVVEIVRQLNLEGRHPHHVVLLDPIEESREALLQLTKTLHPLGVCLSYMERQEHESVVVKPFVLEELLRRCTPHPKKSLSPLKGKRVLICQAGQPMARAVALEAARAPGLQSLALCDVSETMLWDTHQLLVAQETPHQSHLLLSREEESFATVLKEAAPSVVISEPSLSHSAFVEAHLCQSFLLLMKEVRSLVAVCQTVKVPLVLFLLPGEPGAPRTCLEAIHALMEAFLLTKGITVIRTGHIFELPESLPSRIRRALGEEPFIEIVQDLKEYRSLSLEGLGERLILALSQLARNPLEENQSTWLSPDLIVSPQELVDQIAALSPVLLDPPQLRAVPVPAPFMGASFEQEVLPLVKGNAFSRVAFSGEAFASLEGRLQRLTQAAQKGKEDAVWELLLRG